MSTVIRPFDTSFSSNEAWDANRAQRQTKISARLFCLFYYSIWYSSNIVLQVHEIDDQGGVDISGSCHHIRHSQSHEYPGAQAHRPDSKTTAVIWKVDVKKNKMKKKSSRFRVPPRLPQETVPRKAFGPRAWHYGVLERVFAWKYLKYLCGEMKLKRKSRLLSLCYSDRAFKSRSYGWLLDTCSLDIKASSSGGYTLCVMACEGRIWSLFLRCSRDYKAYDGKNSGRRKKCDPPSKSVSVWYWISSCYCSLHVCCPVDLAKYGVLFEPDHQDEWQSSQGDRGASSKSTKKN